MKDGNYTLGLVSVSFRDRTPKEILGAMKATGLSVIEWGSDVHAPCGDGEGLKKIAALQEEYGITCSSYGTYFRLGETPLSELGDYIAAAKVLGTDVLRLWCGVKSGADMTEDERADFLALCREAATLAEAEGVTLCMECHKKTFTERLSDTLWLMEGVGSPRFRMYWQPFQWQSVADNLSYAEAVAPLSEHIHVFNWRDKERLPLADAAEEWRAYLEKFSTPRTLLLEFMPDGRIESLPTEADALRKIIGGTT